VSPAARAPPSPAKGTAKTEGTDSTFSHFSITCGGGACRITTTGTLKDTLPSIYVLAADSATRTSSPFAEPAMKGAKVVDHWVAKPSGNQVTGHGWLTLADKPDSVLTRDTFTATKAP
jgi:hypothetical protein